MSDLIAKPQSVSPFEVGPLYSHLRANQRFSVEAPDRGTPIGNFLRAVELDTFAGQWINNVTSGGFEYEDDPEYSPLADPQLANWQHVIWAFKESKSIQETADMVRRMERNDQLRNQLDGYQAGWSRFFGAMIDPINLIPIPALRGIGFAKGLVRGGAFIGAANVATEIGIQKYDPLRPTEEFMMNMGTGFLMGTAMGGIAGHIKYKGGYRAPPSLLTVIPGYEKLANVVESRFNVDSVGRRFDTAMRGNRPATANLFARAISDNVGLVMDHLKKFTSGAGRNSELYQAISERVHVLQDNLDAIKRWNDTGRSPTDSVTIRNVDGSTKVLTGADLKKLPSPDEADQMIRRLRGSLQEDDIVNIGHLSNDEIDAIAARVRSDPKAAPEVKAVADEYGAIDHFGPAKGTDDANTGSELRGRMLDADRVKPTELENALGLTSRADADQTVVDLKRAVSAIDDTIGHLRGELEVIRGQIRNESAEYKRGLLQTEASDLQEMIGQEAANRKVAQQTLEEAERVLANIGEMHEYSSSKLAPTKVGAQHIQWSQMPWFKLMNNRVERLSPRLAHQLRLTAQKLAAPAGVMTRGQVDGSGACPTSVEGSVFLWRDSKNQATDVMEQQFMGLLGKHMEAGETRGAITVQRVKDYPLDALRSANRMIGGRSGKLQALISRLEDHRQPTYLEFREMVGIFRATNGDPKNIKPEYLQFVEASSRAMDEHFERFREAAQEFGLFQRSDNLTKQIKTLDTDIEAQSRAVEAGDLSLRDTQLDPISRREMAMRQAEARAQVADNIEARRVIQDELDFLQSMGPDQKRKYFPIQWDLNAIEANEEKLYQIIRSHFQANPAEIKVTELVDGVPVERALTLDERVERTMTRIKREAVMPDDIEASRAQYRGQLINEKAGIERLLGSDNLDELYPMPRTMETVGPTGRLRKDGSYSYANTTMESDGTWHVHVDEAHIRSVFNGTEKDVDGLRGMFDDVDQAISFIREHEYTHTRLRSALGEEAWAYDQEINAEVLRAMREGREGDGAIALRRKLDDVERRIREHDEGASVPGTPTMMRERVLDIPTDQILDFINTDMMTVLEQYQRTMAPNVEMARQFGDSRMISALADIGREFDELIAQAAPEDAKWLTVEKEGQLKAIRDLRDSVLGLYKTAPTPDGVSERSLRISQFMKDFSMTTLMGRPVLAAIGDMGMLVFTQGLTPVMRGLFNAFGDFNVKASAYKQGWAEANRAGLLDELNSGLRVQQIYDLTDARVRTSAIEQFMHRNAGRIMVVNGLSWWTDQMRGFASHLVIDRMLATSAKVADGSASSADLALLRKAGISPELAKQFHSAWQRSGAGRYDELFIANTNAWDNPELVRQFRLILNQEVMQSIIQPTAGSKPLFMSDPIWSMMLQYKSFGMAATQSIGLAAAQRTIGQGKYDAGVINGILAMVVMGYMIDSFKTPGWADLDFEEQVFRAVERSGVSGVFMDFNGMLEQATGGSYGMRAMIGFDMIRREPTPADQIGALLGPAANQWGNLAWAMFADDATGDQKARAIRYMVPYNNLVWWHGGVSQLQRDLGSYLEE